jgi:hypothetical protein
MNQVKRIFMNEEDSSPGNGASVPASAPTEPTAAPMAPVFDPETLVTRLMGAFDEKLAAHQNATNAALRKAGVFKQDKPASEPAAPSQPTQSAPVVAQAGLTQADVDARMDARMELERVIAQREGKYGLSEAQSKRLRSHLSGVSRESFTSEADAYLNDWGLAKTPPAPTTVSAQAVPTPAKPNVSDRGTASPVDTRDSEGVLNSRPLEMTGHDVETLVLKHGHEKGMQMFQERVLAALGKVRIKTPGR